MTRDGAADQRLVEAVSHDLRSADGVATATAVRMIWTRDHLDGARRLQAALVGPARMASLARTTALPASSGWPHLPTRGGRQETVLGGPPTAGSHPSDIETAASMAPEEGIEVP
jgi:hypothetical protein